MSICLAYSGGISDLLQESVFAFTALPFITELPCDKYNSSAKSPMHVDELN
jgi:hypothetical protein